MKNRFNPLILSGLLTFFLVLALGNHRVTAQVGNIFPETDVKLITDDELVIPTDTKGKVTLIAVAYSKKSDQALTSWYNPMYNTFIEPLTGGFMPVFQYDVNMYFVGLLGGLKKAANGKIQATMDKNMHERYHKLAGLSNVPMKTYKNLLGLDKKDVPMFYVLDKEGKIIYKTSGRYTPVKMAEIQKAIDSAE